MSHSKSPASLIALVAVVLIGGGAAAYALTGKKTDVTPEPAATTNTQAVASASTTDTATVTTAASVSSASTYKDGTYSATGSYISPGGTEQIGVTLTLKDDVITAASVTPKPVSDDGARFQKNFSANFKQYVVGKDISSVHLTTISGSSLTPGGFNDALSQIEVQAKA